MREFALAVGALEKTTLERLTAATLREDDEQIQSLVKELRFERYCIQFCHWVCFLRCQLFCICVCPPRTIGVFTKIGGLYYDTDVHSHNPRQTGSRSATTARSTRRCASTAACRSSTARR